MTALWWLIASVVFLVIEMVTPGLFFFACMAVGALAAALASWMGGGPWTVWGVFFLTSTLLVLIIAPLARRWMHRIPPSPVGLGSLAGQRARVIQAIDPSTGEGQVRLDTGALWRGIADQPIPADRWVEILEVTGTRLRVRLLEASNPTKE